MAGLSSLTWPDSDLLDSGAGWGGIPEKSMCTAYTSHHQTYSRRVLLHGNMEHHCYATLQLTGIPTWPPCILCLKEPSKSSLGGVWQPARWRVALSLLHWHQMWTLSRTIKDLEELSVDALATRSGPFPNSAAEPSRRRARRREQPQQATVCGLQPLGPARSSRRRPILQKGDWDRPLSAWVRVANTTGSFRPSTTAQLNLHPACRHHFGLWYYFYFTG